MREPSPARRRVARTVAAVAGLARPPAELSARVRWLLLALGLPTMALLALVTVVRSPATWPLLPALGLGGMAAAAALRPRAGGAVLLAAVLAQVPSLTVIATLAYLLGDVLRRQQRVTAREQVLSRVALQGLRAQVALALDRAALTAELAVRATVDPLTGLANRALFLERLGQAVARSAADGTTCALVLLDLDDFKTVNDSLGHLRGDGVLVAVAERLRAQLRAGDTAARLGGDEFAVLLERVGGVRDALAVAERLAAELRKPVAVAGREVQARASVGVRLAAGGDPDELLRDADLAMYAAKRAGHGTVRLFDAAMHERALLRLDFEAALRRAVLEQQFTVRYQPVCELAGGGVVGLEALVRWDHPERGLVMPGEFVGMAEESGLIVPIGRWVLHAACQAARDWQRRFPLVRPLYVGVNLSLRQLQQPDLVQDVAGAVDAAGLAPADLVLELTESVLVLDDEATVQRLHELRALGVHLAVDDFGTGYSSLAYLRRLPVDALKLAGAFVEGLTAGAEQAALAQAIMRLADTLGLQVVAEEVEEADQLRALQGAGLPLRAGLPVRAAAGPVRGRRAAGRRAASPRPAAGGRADRVALTPLARRGRLRHAPSMLASLTGLGLSAAAGLNAYIPLLLVGLLSRFTNVISLPDPYRWIESGWGLGVVSALLLVEVVLDKVPVVDHVNDVVQTLVRPTVGGVIFAATTAAAQADASMWMQRNQWLGWLLGVLVAGAVHAVKATARPLVNVSTVGVGTPVVSAAEDAASLGLSLVAVFLPLLVVVVLLLLAWAVFALARRARRRRAGAAPA